MNITGKRRVSNVKINGEDIDPNKNYTVSMSDYIGNGGDGYTMLSKYDVVLEGLYTDTDSIANYIKNNLNGTIPAYYKEFQGRINLVNGSDSSLIPSSIPSSNPSSNPTSNPSSIASTEEPKFNNASNFYRFNQKKSNGGLSTGGIIAIIISSIVVLIAAGIIAMICSRKHPMNSYALNSNNSNVDLKITQ